MVKYRQRLNERRTRSKVIMTRVTEDEYEAYKACSEALRLSMCMLVDIALKHYLQTIKGT